MITNKNLFASSLGLIFFLICGCATFFQSGPDVAPIQGGTAEDAVQMDTLRLSVEKYRSLAVNYEKDQQLYKAAFMWLMVQKLRPDDRQASKKIADLEERISSVADQHLAQGKKYAKQKSYLSARNEFLMTLAYDPNRKDALEWLTHDVAADGYTVYETKEGDTIKMVARKVYLDPGKDFVVAYFSGLRDDDHFKPGTRLRLPVIESTLSPSEHKPRYNAAPASPPRVQRVHDKAGAEEHYRKGVSFFIAEDMPRAIREWEETLKLDPDHPNARRNIEKARKILKNGRGK